MANITPCHNIYTDCSIRKGCISACSCIPSPKQSSPCSCTITLRAGMIFISPPSNTHSIPLLAQYVLRKIQITCWRSSAPVLKCPYAPSTISFTVTTRVLNPRWCLPVPSFLELCHHISDCHTRCHRCGVPLIVIGNDQVIDFIGHAVAAALTQCLYRKSPHGDPPYPESRPFSLSMTLPVLDLRPGDGLSQGSDISFHPDF